MAVFTQLPLSCPVFCFCPACLALSDKPFAGWARVNCIRVMTIASKFELAKNSEKQIRNVIAKTNSNTERD